MKNLLSERDRDIVVGGPPAVADLAGGVRAKLLPDVTWAGSSTQAGLILAGQYLVLEMAPSVSVASTGERLALLDLAQSIVSAYSSASRRPFSGADRSWLPEVHEELRRFERLPAGWDSYGAPPVEPAQIEAAGRLLSSLAAENLARPTITLTGRGHIQFEWHTQQKDIEIELLAPGRYSILYEEPGSGANWEGTVTGVGALRMIFDHLRSR